MRVQAKIPDVRIHDLRHTFASLLVSGGESLEMIGRLLGHTQIGTTQRYAHLIDSPLWAGVNAVGEMMKPRLMAVKTNQTVFEQEITADLPSNTDFLSPKLFINNGPTAAAPAYNCSGG